MSFSQKIALKEGFIVVLIRGYSPSYQPQYAYMAIQGNRVEAFREALAKGISDVEEYGVILDVGPGDPTPEVMERMERDYLFDHARMLTIDTTAS